VQCLDFRTRDGTVSHAGDRSDEPGESPMRREGESSQGIAGNLKESRSCAESLAEGVSRVKEKLIWRLRS
jgi:hypothetical protein